MVGSNSFPPVIPIMATKESTESHIILNLRAFPLSLILIMALNTPKISIFQTAMRMSTKRSGPTIPKSGPLS